MSDESSEGKPGGADKKNLQDLGRKTVGVFWVCKQGASASMQGRERASMHACMHARTLALHGPTPWDPAQSLHLRSSRTSRPGVHSAMHHHRPARAGECLLQQQMGQSRWVRARIQTHTPMTCVCMFKRR